MEFLEKVTLWLVIYIFLDKLNIPTLIYSKIGIFVIFLIVIYIILKSKLPKTFLKLNIVTKFDLTISSLYFVNTIYFFYALFSFNTSKLKIIVTLILELILTVLIIIREVLIYMGQTKKVKNYEEINVCDLRDLYENNLPNNQNYILLSEEDVDYDLLNRTKIINDLYNSINNCYNEKKFVISLTGKWGSGKTTIINNVKSKLDNKRFVIIDDFDTWKYNNEKSLIYGFFDQIFSKLGIGFSINQMNKLVNACIAMISIKTDISFGNFYTGDKTITYMKKIIKDYLQTNQKRVIFIIDNLERTNEKNIIVILKLISTVLNIDRFIYLLCYDENEMKEIFEDKLKINYDYFEKVVQLPLELPNIDKETISDICETSLKNLLLHYGISKDEIDKYLSTIMLFNENIDNLRIFKRSINSICNSCFIGNNELNKSDYFLIEFIRQKNYSLYKNIENHPKYFLAYDKEFATEYDFENVGEFNKNATEYFNNLFSNSENTTYLEILLNMFPNVRQYKNEMQYDKNNTVQFKGYINKDEYKNSKIDRRISNGRYFDLYFTKNSNDFIKIDNKLKEFIHWLNEYKYKEKSESSKINFKNRVMNLINLYEGYGQQITMETLDLYCDKINNNIFPLILELMINKNNLENIPSFFGGLNASKRASIVCAKLLLRMKDEEFDKFIKNMKNDYKNVGIYRKIEYWMKNEVNPEDNETKLKLEKFTLAYNEICKDIIENEINIYSKENYSLYNIYCIIDENEISYINQYINQENVFKFLADFVSTGVILNEKNKFIYRLNLTEFKKITDYDVIDDILSTIAKEKLNKLEKLILDVYNESKENDKDEMDREISRENCIDLRKIENIE